MEKQQGRQEIAVPEPTNVVAFTAAVAPRNMVESRMNKAVHILDDWPVGRFWIKGERAKADW